jgi:hypothetical protein
MASEPLILRASPLRVEVVVESEVGLLPHPREQVITAAVAVLLQVILKRENAIVVDIRLQ